MTCYIYTFGVNLIKTLCLVFLVTEMCLPSNHLIALTFGLKVLYIDQHVGHTFPDSGWIWSSACSATDIPS